MLHVVVVFEKIHLLVFFPVGVTTKLMLHSEIALQTITCVYIVGRVVHKCRSGCEVNI